VQSGRGLLTFQKCLLPPWRGWWITYSPDDGDSKHLWNICKLLQTTQSNNSEDGYLLYLSCLIWNSLASLLCRRDFIWFYY
jgi:hypothetical protein